MVALTFLVLAGVPIGAHATVQGEASGCGVLADVRDRAACEARAAAREEARAEVERRLGGGDGDGADTAAATGAGSRSADWQAAVDEAEAFDPGALLEPRPLAAVGGLAWFVIAVRARRRARSRRHASA